LLSSTRRPEMEAFFLSKKNSVISLLSTDGRNIDLSDKRTTKKQPSSDHADHWADRTHATHSEERWDASTKRIYTGFATAVA
jgi:hypothetical protein